MREQSWGEQLDYDARQALARKQRHDAQHLAIEELQRQVAKMQAEMDALKADLAAARRYFFAEEGV